MNKTELAAALGVNKSQVTRLCQRGMPTDVAGALEWRRRHLQRARLHETKIAVAGLQRLRHVGQLAAQAQSLLRDGRLPEPHRSHLQAALREVPPKLRAQVALPVSVWHALTHKFQATVETERAAGVDVEAPPSHDDMSPDAFHAIVYGLASGEVQVRP